MCASDPEQGGIGLGYPAYSERFSQANEMHPVYSVVNFCFVVDQKFLSGYLTQQQVFFQNFSLMCDVLARALQNMAMLTDFEGQHTLLIEGFKSSL